VHVREIADIVDQVRAVTATFVPIRIEHDVVDNQLPASFEEIEQTDLPTLSLEGVRLGNFDHREFSALFIDLLPLFGGLFFLSKELLALDHPLVSRHDLRNAHTLLLGQRELRPRWGLNRYGARI
jgi:hypothetical protein